MTLLRHWLRDAWWILIGYIVILEVALVAAILYWPRFRDNTTQIAKLVPFESLQNLLEAVEIEGYWPYLAIQQWFKGCSLFGLAAAAFLTSGLVARDVDQKTAEFLLSRPLSRSRIFLTRWAASCGMVVVPVYLTSLTAIWLSPVVDEQVGWMDVLVSSTFISVFLVMLVTFTAMLSSICSHQLRAGILLIGFILLNFAFYLVQGLDQISLFKAIDVTVFMQIHGGELPWATGGAFAGATVIMLVAGIQIFRARDF